MPDTFYDFNGKNIVIIGGGGLLGKSILKIIHEAGGNIHVLDYRGSNDLSSGDVNFYAVDIADEVDLERTLTEIVDEDGKIDSIINCAYPKANRYGQPLDQVSYSGFCDSVSLHLGGFFNVLRVGTKVMLSQGAGSIISFASIYGVIAPRFDIYDGCGFSMPVEYAAIKGGLIHLNRFFAKKFLGTGLRFNCISPGGIEDGQPDRFQKNYSMHTNTGKMMSSDDVLGTVMFLVSDVSASITGSNIVVDDGFIL